jgi:hypothetical protein
MLSFATEEMIGYKLKELRAEAGRLRVNAPRANREERTSPPRVAVYRGRSASLEELAIEPLSG